MVRGMRKISEGAEADIFESDIFGIRCILKYRRRKPYIASELDEWLRRQRTRSEARSMGIASSSGVNVPKLLFVNKGSIWMGRADGVTLNEYGHIGNTVLSKIGSSLAKLHNTGVIHGDFTKANIMLGRDGNPCIIDFGLSSQSTSIEEKALDLLLLKRSLSHSEFAISISSYMRDSDNGDEIAKRLKEIEMRGRYQNRSIAMKEEQV